MNEAKIVACAAAKDAIQSWTFSFINTKSAYACDLQVTGVGLASGGGQGHGQQEWYEALILMDNTQYFFLHLTPETNQGWYRIIDSLDEATQLPLSGKLLISKARDTMAWYPL